MYAGLGQMAGGLAAAKFVKCFVDGTPVWIPSNSEHSDVILSATYLHAMTATKRATWQQSVGAGLLVTSLASWAALEHWQERKKRKKSINGTPVAAVSDDLLLPGEGSQDSIWTDEQLLENEPYALEELARSLLAARADRTDRLWAWM